METENTVLRGIRIQLVPFSVKHWKDVASFMYNDTYKDFFRQYPRVFNEEELQNYPRMVGGDVFMAYSIESNKLVGMAQVVPSDKNNKGCFLGAIVCKEEQKNRVGQEINYVLMEYLFNKQGYNKVIVEILESATHLKRGFESSGWYKEGKLLQECFIDGKYQNELRFSMSSYYFNKNIGKFKREHKSWVDSSKT